MHKILYCAEHGARLDVVNGEPICPLERGSTLQDAIDRLSLYKDHETVVRQILLRLTTTEQQKLGILINQYILTGQWPD